jgi:branched-subunit amino acid transport protein
MNLWWIIIGMGLITFALRLSLLAVAGRLAIPRIVEKGLRFAPAAVLSAIVFTEVLQPDGRLDVSPGNPRLVAGIVALIIAYRTKNVLLTIAGGMLILWIMQWLGLS